MNHHNYPSWSSSSILITTTQLHHNHHNLSWIVFAPRCRQCLHLLSKARRKVNDENALSNDSEKRWGERLGRTRKVEGGLSMSWKVLLGFQKGGGAGIIDLFGSDLSSGKTYAWPFRPACESYAKGRLDNFVLETISCIGSSMKIRKSGTSPKWNNSFVLFANRFSLDRLWYECASFSIDCGTRSNHQSEGQIFWRCVLLLNWTRKRFHRQRHRSQRYH